jgi:hypothetical protein
MAEKRRVETAGDIGDHEVLIIGGTVVASPHFFDRKALDSRVHTSSRGRRMGAGPRC